MEDTRKIINLRDKRCPAEVRLKIFQHLVALEQGLRCPNLLLAVGKHPDMYAEACEAYRESNYVLTNRNQAKFKRFKVAEMMKIRHLTIIYEGSKNTPKKDWLSIKGNKVACFNNLETVTLDISGDGIIVAGSPRNLEYQALQRPECTWLARASIPGISKISMMFQVNQNTERAINEMKKFYFDEPRECTGGQYGDDKRIFVWEGKCGKRLLS